MRKTILPVLSIIGLLIVFAVTYNIAKQLGPKQQADQTAAPTGFTTEQLTVGEVGGSHYLRGSKLEDKGGFMRLTVETQLNRPSLIEDDISTPLTTAKLVKEAGKHYVLIDLADTTNIYMEEGRKEDLYAGLRGAIVNYPPITELEVLPATESGQQLKLWIDQEAPKGIRLSANPENTGNLWLDILR